MKVTKRNRFLLPAAALAALMLTGCEEGSEGAADAKPSKPASSAPSVSAEDRAKAREAAGLPESPAPADRAAYIDGLNAIDPDIVHGEEDKAVSRGINACSGIKNFPGDRDKQVEMTGARFSSPDSPEGRDAATAGKILDLAHKYICPDF